jgi:hypothetical protein
LLLLEGQKGVYLRLMIAAKERDQDDSPQDAEKNQLPALRLFPNVLMALTP